MATRVVSEISGLQTAPDSNEASPGAFALADDTVCDVIGILEPRRGLKRLLSGLASATARCLRAFVFRTALVLARDDTAAFLLLPANGDPTTDSWSVGSQFVIPRALPGFQPQGTQALQSFYVTSSRGSIKVDSTAGAGYSAGMPQGLWFGVGVLGTADVNGILPSGVTISGVSIGASAAAWRVTYTFFDANGVAVEGPPSGRVQVVNSSGSTQRATVAPALPKLAELPPNFTGGNLVVTVYRSKVALTPTGQTTILPDDEMGIVSQQVVALSDVTNGFTPAFIDSTPDTLRGASLYTNPNSGDGSLASNFAPPAAACAAFFKGSLFLGNVVDKNRLQLQIVGLGSPSGLQVGDVLTIGGVSFACISGTPAFGSTDFQLSTGLPTVSQNIEATARSLCQAINGNPSPTFSSWNFRAQYASGQTDPPGIITLEEIGVGGSGFTVTCNPARPIAFNPPLGTTATAATTSSNSAKKHRLRWSKSQQPEAFPISTNQGVSFQLDIGSPDAAILQLEVLRDRLFVFKEDGLFVVTGTSAFAGDFQYQIFDPTLLLLGPDTVQPLDNAIFCFTTQGAAKVTENGSVPLSLPIDIDIRTLAARVPGLAARAWAIGYSESRRYILSLPVAADPESQTTFQYVYNIATQTWTRWAIPQLAHGVMGPAALGVPLYLKGNLGQNLSRERKSYTSDDYRDEDFTSTIASVVGLTVTLSGTPVVAGSRLLDVNGLQCTVLSVDSTGLICTVDASQNLATGACTVQPPIQSSFRWLPLGTQGSVRQWQKIHFGFRVLEVQTPLNVSVFSDMAAMLRVYPHGGPAAVPAGTLPAGTYPAGTRCHDVQLTQDVSQEFAPSSTITVGVQLGQAGAKWELQDLVLWYVETPGEIGA